MRSLATTSYTSAQVEAQLRSGHAAFSQRFDVLSSGLAKTGTLAGVTAATVEWDTTRDIVGTLTVTVEATSALQVGSLIQPYWVLGMPDGGTVEFPLGVYAWWASPSRDLGKTPDLWTATLPDLGSWLDEGSPSLSGYSVNGVWTDSIATILADVGLTDTSGITGSTASPAYRRTWDITDDRGTLQTWRRVLRDHHEALGYWPGWFDANGRYIAQAQPTLSTASPTAYYGTSTTGVTLIPATTSDQKLRQRANYVIARAELPDIGEVYGVADADALYPTHPWARNRLGRYIRVLYNSRAESAATVQVAAENELARRMAGYETLQFSSLAWPVHECYEILRWQWDGDATYSTATKWLETGWALDLFAGTMTHSCERIAS